MFYHHKKEKEYENKLKNILKTRYDDDIHKLKEAQKDLDFEINLNKNKKALNKINICLNNNIIDNKEKYTYVNFKKDEMFLTNINTLENIILSQSIDYLAMQRILPITVTSFFNIMKEKDYNKKTNKNDVFQIFNYIRDRICSKNITLSNISINKNTGVIDYSTTTMDGIYGGLKQNFLIRADIKRSVNLNNLINGKIENLIKDYNLLFSFFTLFGFNEIYARCNCPEYNRNYNKRVGMGNYFCNHLLFSMSLFPYYAMNILLRSLN